jgi:hypothetical protein
LYLCSRENLQGDTKVSDFVKLFSSLLNLSEKETESMNIEPIKDKLLRDIIEAERFILLLNLSVLAKKEAVLIDKSEKGMRMELYIRLKEKMEALTGQNALVIYLAEHQIEMNMNIHENFDFHDITEDWTYMTKI